MWVGILKYAAKAAIAAGLHKKVLVWLRGKLEKAEQKAITKFNSIGDTIEELYEASDEPVFDDDKLDRIHDVTEE